MLILFGENWFWFLVGRVKLQIKRHCWHGLNTIDSVRCRTNSEDAQSPQENAPINFSNTKRAMLFESILLPRLRLWRKARLGTGRSPPYMPIFFDNYLLLCHQDNGQAVKLMPLTNMDSNSVKLYSQDLYYIIFHMNAI